MITDQQFEAYRALLDRIQELEEAANFIAARRTHTSLADNTDAPLAHAAEKLVDELSSAAAAATRLIMAAADARRAAKPPRDKTR